MPSFRKVVAMAANGTSYPLQEGNWIYERLPFRAAVDVFLQATDTNVLADVVIGSDVQEQEGPVPGGATAGEFPTTVPPTNRYYGTAGDKILLKLRETAGGTPSVNVWIVLTPF